MLKRWEREKEFVRQRYFKEGRPYGRPSLAQRGCAGARLSLYWTRILASVLTKQYHRRVRYLMGSSFQVTGYGEKEICSKGIEAAFSELARIERLLSIYRPDSPLAAVNRFSRKGTIPLPPEALHLLSKALCYAERSGGAFDPTAGPLVRLWGFGPGKERASPPGREEILSFLQRVGYQHLQIDFQSESLRLLQAGIELNLGGIGKGYAIDRAVQKLKEAGVQIGMVDCGSTMYGLGAPPGQTGWQVAVRHPRLPEGEAGVVSLCDQALSTSGDYEKFFIFQGKRFSHLIDPRSGYPVKGSAGVSVVASNAMEADALSTAAFVLGDPEGRKLLEAFPRVEGLLLQESADGALVSFSTRGWDQFPARKPIGRRRFLAVASLALAAFFLPHPAHAVVYSTEEEALKKMMPEADHFDVEEIHLSPDQASKAQELAGKAFRESDYRFTVGRKGPEAVGYALKLEVIGKERPITFLIGIEPQGEVRGIEVLIYRESEGSEIRHPRFMKQFFKKKNEDPLRLGQDIQPISGATLSSRAAAYGVRKALSIFEVVYKKKAESR